MINASILFTVDGVKQRAPLIPVNPADKNLDGIVEFDPTTKSFRVKKDIVIHSIEIERDAFINGNAIVAGDLEVRGTTFSSEVENVQADGDWIVLRANNPTPLAAGDYAGFVFHNYNNLGKDAAITVDNTGTFRISTQTSEAVSPLSNTWLVDEEYFIENVDFSQATLMSENYPVTRYSEVFTDIEAYKANNTHYFYDPEATPIEYHDNVVYNNVTQKVELAGNVVSFTPSSSDVHHEVHFYTSISFMEPQASDMEAIATRDETSNWDNNEIAMYDTTTEKFVGIGEMPSIGGQVLTYNAGQTAFDKHLITVNGIQYEEYPTTPFTGTIPAGCTETADVINFTTTGDYYYSSTENAIYIDDNGTYVKLLSAYYNSSDEEWVDGETSAAVLPADAIAITAPSATHYNRAAANAHYEWKSGGSGSVSRFATLALAQAALAIPEGQDGYIPNNGIVIVDELDAVIKGDNK